MELEVKYRVQEGAKIMGGLSSLWRNKEMAIDVKMEMPESIGVPTIFYGSESWVLNVSERKEVEGFDIKCLGNVLLVGVIHNIKNRDIKGRCGNKGSPLERLDVGTFR